MRDDDDARDGRPVLVVEDCDDDFDTVVEAAARAQVGNALIRARDGEGARSLLSSHPAGAFVFMLLDYNLPGMDGLDLLQCVRLDHAMALLPAIVLTTSVNPRDHDAFRAAGANAFHVKCVQHAQSMRTLESIFEHWLPRPVRLVAPRSR